jgi:hypothetical protein
MSEKIMQFILEESEIERIIKYHTTLSNRISVIHEAISCCLDEQASISVDGTLKLVADSMEELNTMSGEIDPLINHIAVLHTCRRRQDD